MNLRVRDKGISRLAMSDLERYFWWFSLLEMMRMAREEGEILRGRRRV